MIALEDFVVLRSLRIHKPIITPRRVQAVYEIIDLDGNTFTNTLFYTYNDKLFNKKDLADQNLASMMVAQVAMNYGLFCRELIFDGNYDKTDQQLIKDMTENTSREILCNKLVDNPFLTEEFTGLVPEKRERYTQAEIKFTQPACKIDSAPACHGTTGRFAKANPEAYAILSSGGKDSLVSYGMIKEFSYPHPIYVNEAGRHWFTAVNAFRRFRESEPRTNKVWCNSDRIFNWMLRHLKFIKPNYASIRADIYPVRLWTVSVFLFGVLPIALKQGLKNIIVGDEYDTTEKKSLNGITHYAALYDQSKYFDNAMTRFYARKGWDLYQFSLLRSMSELLIMKVLLKRYPDLQKEQVSCHAAHEHEKRMYPCGKCEKCRRIIGMITALESDPKNCGYSDLQIELALQKLSNTSIKQIGSDAAHLYHMLLEKGAIEKNEFTKRLAKSHPRVMELRFDEQRSNLEDLPEYVRLPLFNILDEYADGAVIRKNNGWEDQEITPEFLAQKKYKYANAE
jgi:hypothetical protein